MKALLVSSLFSAILVALGLALWVQSNRTVGVHRLVLRRSLPASAVSSFRADCLSERLLPMLPGGSESRAQIRNARQGEVEADVICERLIEGEPPSDDILLSTSTSTSSGVLVLYSLVEPCERPRADRWVVWNAYHPKPGREAEVLSWRLHACEVREKLNRPAGCVWKRERGPEDQPYVLWSLATHSVSEEVVGREKDMAATPEFQAVMAHMRTLIDGFEMDLWRVYAAQRRGA